jgi:tetratricopeptide (TPR) repeat protein
MIYGQGIFLFRLFIFSVLLTSCASFKKTDYNESVTFKKYEYPKSHVENILSLDTFSEYAKKTFLNLSPSERKFFINDLYLKGVDLKEQGEAKGASRLFGVLYDIIPFDDSVRKSLIVSYIRSNQLEKAEVVLESIINNESGNNISYKLILAGLQNARGEISQSKKTYKDVLLAEPANEEACVFLSKTLSNEGEHKSAIKKLKSCLKSSGENATLTFYLAKAYLNLKNSSKADKFFRKTLSIEPTFYQAVIARSLIRETKGELKKALTILREYLEKVDNENFAILTRATQIMFELNMVSEITPYLEEMLRQDPENLNLKVRLGIIYSETSAYDKAKESFQSILEKVPDSDRVLYYLGALYQETSEFDKAISYYSQIGPKSTLYFDSNLQIGLLVRQMAVSQNRPESGIKKLEQLKDSLPESYAKKVDLKRELDFYISYIMHDLEDYQGALSFLLGSFQEEELTVDQKFFVASLYEKLKDYNSAINIMMSVIQKDPKNAHALNFVGYVMLENTEQVTSAYDYIKKAVELEPNDAYIRDSLGWYFYKKGDFKKALREVKKAWQGEKKDVVITKHLAIIYQKLNNVPEAKKYFIEALKNCQKHAEKLDVIKSMDRQMLRRLPASIVP